MTLGLSWDTGSSSPWAAHSLPAVDLQPSLGSMSWLPPGLSLSPTLPLSLPPGPLASAPPLGSEVLGAQCLGPMGFPHKCFRVFGLSPCEGPPVCQSPEGLFKQFLF